MDYVADCEIDAICRQLRETDMKRQEDAYLLFEQAKAYKKSLEADKKKKEEKERKEREDRENEEVERQAKEERDECSRIIEEKRKQLKSLRCGETPVDGEAVRIRFVFPSGEKIVRVFSVDDSVESIFIAAFSHPSCPSLFSMESTYPT